MHRGALVFWLLVAVLVGSSTFFGIGAWRRRDALKHPDVELHTGDVVHLARTIDGDTIVVRDASGNDVTLRILGIKAFEPEPERDQAARFGREAMSAIEELTRNQDIQLLVNNPPKDKQGRMLATLFAGDVEIGLELLKRGVCIVYTRYPFPSMSVYLQAQAEARAAHRGLWSDASVSDRATALAREWGKDAP